MSDKWMTVAAAAATLNVHPRTIERRIASAKIESRRADDGQLQVLVQVVDEAATGTEAFDAVRELAQDQVSLATGSASALVKFAQADADRARGELSLIRQEAGRARQSARFAWAAVAVMAIAVCAAVGWTSHKMTRTADDLQTLSHQADAIKADAERMRMERDTARLDAETARIASAKVEGHLEAFSQTADKSPTTKPTNFVQWVTSVFSPTDP